jgi:hypothetical protein
MIRRVSIFVLLLGVAAGPVAAQGGAQNSPGQQRHHEHQGPHAGDWLRRNLNLPPDQQQKALESDPNFRSLPPERQQRLRERLREFNNRSPEERQRIIQRMDAWDHLTPQQRTRARDMFTRLRALPPERRQALSEAFRSLRDMNPADRERALSSTPYRSFSDNERDLLRGMTELNIGPGRRHGPGEPQ